MAIECAADCPRAAVKRGYCETHYQHIRKFGEIRPVRYLRTTPKVCVICGAKDWPDNGRRRHCSGRCQQLSSRHKGNRPSAGSCRQCGAVIDFFGKTPNGQFRRTDTKLCAACHRAKSLRHRVSVGELYARGERDCGICGEPVDQRLRFPDPRSASIDHIVPFAHGGTHDMSNLQLAHLRCNHVKSDRLPIVGLTAGVEGGSCGD